MHKCTSNFNPKMALVIILKKKKIQNSIEGLSA